MTGAAPRAAALWAPPHVPTGWALRAAEGRRCAQCGEAARMVHQRRRFVGHRWEDEPGAVLCLPCFGRQYTRWCASPPSPFDGHPDNRR